MGVMLAARDGSGSSSARSRRLLRPLIGLCGSSLCRAKTAQADRRRRVAAGRRAWSCSSAWTPPRMSTGSARSTATRGRCSARRSPTSRPRCRALIAALASACAEVERRLEAAKSQADLLLSRLESRPSRRQGQVWDRYSTLLPQSGTCDRIPSASACTSIDPAASARPPQRQSWPRQSVTRPPAASMIGTWAAMS